MDKVRTSELKEILVILKTLNTKRDILRKQVERIDKVLKTYHFGMGKTVKDKKMYVTEYNNCGEAIDALFSVFNYLRKGKITMEEVNQINKAVPLYLIPPDILIRINEINSLNGLDEYDIKDYLVKYFKNLRSILIRQGADKQKLAEFEMIEKRVTKKTNTKIELTRKH